MQFKARKLWLKVSLAFVGFSNTGEVAGKEKLLPALSQLMGDPSSTSASALTNIFDSPQPKKPKINPHANRRRRGAVLENPFEESTVS